MNIYQGLLFLHGFRVGSEDVTEGGVAAGTHVAAAVPADEAPMVPERCCAATVLPAAGA